MESRYSAEDATRAASRHASVSEDLALRTYTARLLGADGALVLHGGGNTSVKSRATTTLGETVDVLHIKGSGWDLATIEPAGHPAVRLEPLLRLRALGRLDDEAMVNELRLALLDAAAPTPSVEALLHAFLPAKFIDHTHADAILAIADQPDGERVCRGVFGPALVWVPYVMPGFLLAKRCAEAFERTHAENPSAGGAAPGSFDRVLVLERHGLFTLGATARESYERTIAAVTLAEKHIAERRRSFSVRALEREASAPADEILPRLRGVLARLAGEPPERGPILELDDRSEMLTFLDREDAFELSQVGCATPDHVIRTKPTALFVRKPEAHDLAKLTLQLENEVTLFARRYDTYFADTCARKGATKTKLDPWPRVILLPGLGACSVGKTRREACIARDIYAHTASIMQDARAVGAYAPVPRDDLFDVEYWSLEQAKIKKAAEPVLFGKVALVTGAASGIGRATAERFLSLGASVMLMDKQEGELEATAATLARAKGAEVLPVACDVTSWERTESAVKRAVRHFGGLDVVVSNAGNAPEGQLHTQSGEAALRASLDLNLLSHNHIARAATPVMLAQGRGGCILFNASKSAFNQGPNFGPYAVAKAGLLALMRQYAVDLGRYGIRANAVNADRIRTKLFGGGVVESRAASRGLSVEEYFRANLLQREVTAEDVADAFVYLATARATTGCVLTVDGGNAAAFPR